MNKLIVNFSNKIVTGSLYSQNTKTYENHGSKLSDIFSKTHPDTLGVEVVMVNDGREIVFILTLTQFPYHSEVSKSGSLLF